MSVFTNNQIDINSLPKVEEVSLIPISKDYLVIVIFNILIVYLTIVLGLSIIRFFFDSNFLYSSFWYITLGIALIGLIHLTIYILGFKNRKYALREKDVIYTSGYIQYQITTLPLNRIQHIEIARSFLARQFNLSTLKIYSAGESGGDIAIKGLPKEVAEKQYTFLTEILNERA